MFSALNQLNRFFDLATEKTLSGSDQLVYLHLFNKFNRAHWTETILVRDAELQELCKLYDANGKPASIETIRNAKARLKAKGLIEFTAGKGSQVTRYKLLRLYPSHTPTDTPAYTPYETPADTFANPSIRAREDVKTKDIQSSTPPARACAQVDWDCEIEERLTQLWLDNNGTAMTIELLSYLRMLVAKHGIDWTETIIREAASGFSSVKLEGGRRTTMSPNYLRGCVDRKLKGGEKHGENRNENRDGKVVAINSGRPYAVPKRTGNEPWLSYPVEGTRTP